MNNIEKKDKIQQKALKAWINSNKRSSVEIATGIGKTFISLHALYTMPRDDSVTHLFLAEVKDRENDLIKDIVKYNKIFNRDVFKDYNLEFYCYQTVYKWKNKHFGLVIMDECHEQMSKSYSKFHKNNTYDALIGLSATINKNTEYKLDNGQIITKGDLLNQIAPICFKYSLKQAREENTARELEIHVIYTKLDNTNKYIKAGNQFKRFFQTEQASYDYWDKEFKKSLFIEDEELKQKKIILTSSKRQSIIFNSLEKVIVVKKLTSYLKNKTIIFANNLDSLLKVTPNVISSRNKDEENDSIKKAFQDNKIKVIASFKKLKQGTNLSNLDNVILMSYYGTTLDYVQRLGRLRENGTLGYVYILLCKETQELVWFNNMIEDINTTNIKYYENINEFLKLNNG